MVIILTIISMVAIFWIFYKARRRHLEYHGEQFPGEKAYPIIGNGWKFIKAKTSKQIVDCCFDTINKYKHFGIGRAWIGNMLGVVVGEPKYVEVIANSPYSSEKSPAYEILFGSLFAGVFGAVDTAKWKELKKPLIRTLAKSHIENEHHSIFIEKSKLFVENMKKKKCGVELNIIDEVRHLTLDIISATHLGVTTNEIQEPRFYYLAHIIRTIDDCITVSAKAIVFRLERMLNISWLTEDNNKVTAFNFLKWVLDERAKLGPSYDKGGLKYYPDFLLKRQKEKNLSTNVILPELADLVSAGSDTSAVLNSSALLFFAMFPELQEEAYQEQVSILGEDPLAEPTPQDLSSMLFLDRFIKETLRYCCPVLVIKYATADIALDQYTIPKGTHIGIPFKTLCEDPRFWERPTSFFPDHFLPEKEAERPYYAFTPFGVGPRKCPGKQYALSSVKTFLSFILRNFKLSTSMKFEDIVVEPKIMRDFKSYNVVFEVRNKT